MDEIFFKTFVCLYFPRRFYANTSRHQSHWLSLLRGGQTIPSVWFGHPLLLSGALLHPHLGYSLLFRSPSLGTGSDHELHPGRRNGTQQGRMGRDWWWLVTNAGQVRRPTRKTWVLQTIFGPLTWTYLQLIQNRVRKGIGRAVLFCNLCNVHTEKSDLKLPVRNYSLFFTYFL